MILIKNLGVSAAEFADASAMVENLLPEEGHKGNNWEAPPFTQADAWAEIHPYSHGRFEIRVLQKGVRVDVTSNGGRVTYPTNFRWVSEYVK